MKKAFVFLLALFLTLMPALSAPAAEARETVNLIFIHHSCGENWLNDGLCEQLNQNGFHVADITYGWRAYGDHTDTCDWPLWFTDGVMSLVYGEMGTMSAANTLAPASGENTVVMFKSCYPCSDAGESIQDEQAVYQSLLPYFESRPDKLFILVTPPPMIDIPFPEQTRKLCDWLCDRQAGWLSGLSTGNVFVFDFYNVLTDPDAHHCYDAAAGAEVHTAVEGANTLYYDSDGDDHPDTVKTSSQFRGTPPMN